MKEFREIVARLRGNFLPTQRNSPQTEDNFSITPTEIAQRLNAVLALEPENHRMHTYARLLHSLPEGALQNSKRILEIGMNDNLLRFRDVFSPDIELFGITIDPDHASRARQAGRDHGVKTEVVICDIDNGLPKGFQDMDLVLDVYAASHYAKESPLPKYVRALNRNGVLAYVPGSGFMEGYADHIRNHPERDDSAEPQVAFRYRVGEPIIAYVDIPRIADLLRLTAFKTLKPDASEEEISNCIKEIAHKLGHQQVTNFDLVTMARISELESVGLSNIHKFSTLDGTGWIGKKS
jgi:hypothetical protein